MKQETPEQKLKKFCDGIISEREVWKHINEEGCSDPFWPDGMNMNLTRNHILSYRNEIAEICEECGFNIHIDTTEHLLTANFVLDSVMKKEK